MAVTVNFSPTGGHCAGFGKIESFSLHLLPAGNLFAVLLQVVGFSVYLLPTGKANARCAEIVATAVNFRPAGGHYALVGSKIVQLSVHILPTKAGSSVIIQIPHRTVFGTPAAPVKNVFGKAKPQGAVSADQQCKNNRQSDVYNLQFLFQKDCSPHFCLYILL